MSTDNAPCSNQDEVQCSTLSLNIEDSAPNHYWVEQEEWPNGDDIGAADLSFKSANEGGGGDLINSFEGESAACSEMTAYPLADSGDLLDSGDLISDCYSSTFESSSYLVSDASEKRMSDEYVSNFRFVETVSKSDLETSNAFEKEIVSNKPPDVSSSDSSLKSLEVNDDKSIENSGKTNNESPSAIKMESVTLVTDAIKMETVTVVTDAIKMETVTVVTDDMDVSETINDDHLPDIVLSSNVNSDLKAYPFLDSVSVLPVTSSIPDLKFQEVKAGLDACNEGSNKIPVTFEKLNCDIDTPGIASAITLKMDISSEDEEVFFDAYSAKSGGESSSSKDENHSGPSCSGTSQASLGVNSLSSDSENDLPSINLSLPIKKRKRESQVEVICSDSSADSEDSGDIDYSNLTPEEIKALIEEARRYGRVKKRCKCPKKKWSELPIVGPIKPSGKCTIGKGDWSENIYLPCADCAAGNCTETHKRSGRRSRRKSAQPRLFPSRPKSRSTIGQDVPIIELSDSEETISVSKIVSNVTITALPAKECIVLSSSEDDDDIVCEAVIKTDEKNQTGSSGTLKSDGQDSVFLLQPASSAQTSTSTPINLPPAPDPEWPDINEELNIDIENWNETMHLLANIGETLMTSAPQPTLIAPVQERPPTPEGWSCPICLESKTAVNEIMSTTCGHVFCGNCIRSAVKIHKKCPTCRKKLTAKQFHKIFL